MTRSVRIAVFAAIAAAFAFPAFAEETLCMDVTSKKTIDEAKAAAVAAGFADITGMGEEHGCYEAKGLNADGSKFEVYIHPTDLKIVKVKMES